MFIQQDKIMVKKRGFTMIEMLIVISMFIVLLPTIFAILSTILRQQLRLYRIVEAKRQGDAALAFMKERISREGYAVQDTFGNIYCDQAGEQYTTSDGTRFRFLLGSGNTLYFFRERASVLEYVTAPPTISTSLTANTVQISNFQISCYRRSLNSPPIIQISYTVLATDNISTISLPYKTKVRLLLSAP